MSCDATLEIFWGAAPFSLVGAGASSSSFFIGLLWKIKKTLNNNIGCEISHEKFRRWFSTEPDLLSFNPFTLKSSSRNIVCYLNTFENNLGMKRNFTKYLKEIYCLSSD